MKSKGGFSISNNNNIIIIGLSIIILILIAIILYHGSNKPIKKESSLIGAWVWDANAINSGITSFEPCDIAILFGTNTQDPDSVINGIINDVSGVKNAREKFLALGIGQVIDTNSLEWKKSDFININNQLSNIKAKGWTGVCFNVVTCTNNVPFTDDFKTCFYNCKAAGLKVLVTISQLIPSKCQSGTGQGMDLVNAWINDPNIDYISPQLFQHGFNEKTLIPSDLSIFKKAKAKIIPSIPYATNWSEIQNLGIVPGGYIAWLQPRYGICGTSAENAMDNYEKGIAVNCLSDTGCSSGQKCFM